MKISKGGAVLAYTSSGTAIVPPVSQELFMINKQGEVLRAFNLSDTVYQHLDAVPAVDGGFFLSATSNSFPYISLYHVNDAGNVIWQGSIPRNAIPASVENTSEPEIIVSRDGNYMILYQSGSNIYRVWKGDANGNTLSDNKFQAPNAVHDPTGLNYGQKYVNLLDANDTLIAAQGVLFTEYPAGRIENCFIRTTDQNLLKKSYSSDYNPVQMEIGRRLAYRNGKIILFGARADNPELKYHGNAFARIYSLACDLENEIRYPPLNGTPTTVSEVVDAPDGGWLLTGSNGQFPSNDLVSPNSPVLYKIRPDLSVEWSKAIGTAFPARGLAAVYHKDGTIGLIGLLKDKYAVNKLLYVHLDGSGGIINN